MDEPNRIERLVGEIIGLRLLVATLVEKQGGVDSLRTDLMGAIDAYDVRSDTEEGAARIKTCGTNMLRNFPDPMDAKITSSQ